jgi:hypothetical protein
MPIANNENDMALICDPDDLNHIADAMSYAKQAQTANPRCYVDIGIGMDKCISWSPLDGWLFRHGDGTLIGPMDNKEELIAYVLLYCSGQEERKRRPNS